MADGLVTAMSYRCIDGDRNGLGSILVGTKPELTVSVALLYRAQGAQKGAQTEEPRFLSPPIGRLTLPQSAGQAFFFWVVEPLAAGFNAQRACDWAPRCARRPLRTGCRRTPVRS